MKPHLKIGFAMIILAFGCKKYEVDSNTTNVPGQTSEVPNDFSWTTTQDLQTRFQFDSELTSKTVTFELLDQNFNRIYKLYKESGKSSMAIDQIVSNQLDSFYFYAPQISVFSKHPITANNITISEPTAGIRGNYVPPARTLEVVKNRDVLLAIKLLAMEAEIKILTPSPKFALPVIIQGVSPLIKVVRSLFVERLP